ncbi:MAG: hypothetical protein LBD68_06190 [Zoogloeaceae bacterium]|jgi:hypothetical protein|nr:hypothetical protein [Zoogloeaceae bacterium]
MLRFSRPRRLLLLLESGGACLYVRQFRAPRVRELARFTPDAAGRQALSALLESAPGESVRLLVNLPEEAYVQENIPRLRGGERSALISRKLRQHFGGNPFVMACSQGEVMGRRREERLSLTALPDRPLREWLAALGQTPVVGIHAMPHVMAEILRRVAGLPSVCLLLTLHARALRQTLLQDGRVVFSRLSPAPDDAERSVWIAGETGRLYAYLVHRQHVENVSPLPVFLLAGAPDAEAGEIAAAFAHPDMASMRLQPLEWRKRAPAPEMFAAEALPLACLAAWPPRQHHAPADLRRQYHLPGYRRLLLGAGVSFLLAGVCSGGIDLLAARGLQTQNSAARLDVLRLEAQSREILRDNPALAAFSHIEAGQARRLLDEYARYRAERAPEAMLHALRQLAVLLSQHPGIHLEKLRWQAAEAVLNLNGRASAADLARFLRHLARAGMNHEYRQPPEGAAADSAAPGAAPFDLLLALPSAP